MLFKICTYSPDYWKLLSDLKRKLPLPHTNNSTAASIGFILKANMYAHMCSSSCYKKYSHGNKLKKNLWFYLFSIPLSTSQYKSCVHTCIHKLIYTSQIIFDDDSKEIIKKIREKKYFHREIFNFM